MLIHFKTSVGSASAVCIGKIFWKILKPKDNEKCESAFPEHFDLEQATSGRSATHHGRHRLFRTLHNVLRVLPEAGGIFEPPGLGPTRERTSQPNWGGQVLCILVEVLWRLDHPLAVPRILKKNRGAKTFQKLGISKPGSMAWHYEGLGFESILIHFSILTDKERKEWFSGLVANKECLEKVQKKGGWHGFRPSSKGLHEGRPREMGMVTVEERRHQLDMLQTYKMLAGKDRVSRDTW